jgi:hypothetical protein
MIQPRKLEERVNTDSIPRGEEYPTIQYEPAALSCPVLSVPVPLIQRWRLPD